MFVNNIILMFVALLVYSDRVDGNHFDPLTRQVHCTAKACPIFLSISRIPTTLTVVDSTFTQMVIIFATAPVFLIVVVVTALLIGYLLCDFSKNQEDAEPNSAAEVVGQVLEMQENSSSVSTSASGSGSLEKSHLQGRGNILIDEYGIPIDDSISSSEILGSIPPHPHRVSAGV